MFAHTLMNYRIPAALCIGSLLLAGGCSDPEASVTATQASTKAAAPAAPDTQVSPAAMNATPERKPAEDELDAAKMVSPTILAENLERELKRRADSDFPASGEHFVIAEPTLLELGEMGPGESRTGTITLRNTTERPIRVVDCRTSCGCTVTDGCPRGRELEPGEEVGVEIRLTGGQRAARESKTVTFLVDGQPPLTATVRGDVVTYVTMEPSNFHPDQSAMGKVVLRSEDGQEFRITSVSADIVGALPQEAGIEHELDLSWDAWRERGEPRQIVFFTDHPRAPQLRGFIHSQSRAQRPVNPRQLTDHADPASQIDRLDNARAARVVHDVPGLIRQGNLDALKERLDAGLEVETTDATGLTLLAQAAKAGKPEIIQALIESGADLHATDKSGQTPLMWAAQSKNAEAVRVLVEAGSDIDRRDSTINNTALSWAAFRGDAASVAALLDAGARVDVVSVPGYTPLIWAAAFGDPANIPLLIEAGADLDGTDGMEGLTPIMHAARTGRSENILALVRAGASLESRDPSGRTVLLAASAASGAGPEVIRALVEAGADVTARDRSGKSALDIARSRNDVRAASVVAVLEGYLDGE
jgi:ankyrin repeat protein